MRRYKIRRLTHGAKYFIEIGHTETRFKRRSFWEGLLRFKKEITFVTVGDGDTIQKYVPPLREGSSWRHYAPGEYVTRWFDTVAEAQKAVDKMIAADRVDNYYDGGWQP